MAWGTERPNGPPETYKVAAPPYGVTYSVEWLRLSVAESLLRASEDALHKFKTFAGANMLPQGRSGF